MSGYREGIDLGTSGVALETARVPAVTGPGHMPVRDTVGEAAAAAADSLAVVGHWMGAAMTHQAVLNMKAAGGADLDCPCGCPA